MSSSASGVRFVESRPLRELPTATNRTFCRTTLMWQYMLVKQLSVVVSQHTSDLHDDVSP
jgi:hypothetical protein